MLNFSTYTQMLQESILDIQLTEHVTVKAETFTPLLRHFCLLRCTPQCYVPICLSTSSYDHKDLWV